MDDSNSFFCPYIILPIAQGNKYLGIFLLFFFFNFIMVLYVMCTHRGDSNEYTEHTIIV